jgi:hypothetical protein
VTIGVVTVAYGEKYRRFLPQWAEAIANLQRPPDAVTIIVDHLDCPQVKTATDLLGANTAAVQIQDFTGNTPHVLANQAISITDTEWICRLDVDDLIYPHAFTRLDSWTTNVSCFGINVNNEHGLLPSPVTARDVLACPHNLLFAGSPFRRETWAATPGFLDIAYNDWAFWRACARIGATFHPTGTIDYFYRQHSQSTTSKVNHEEEIQHMLRSEGK